MPSPADDSGWLSKYFVTGELINELSRQDVTEDRRPWGQMKVIGSPSLNFTLKHLKVELGKRTSLQVHDHKDEVLIILSGSGLVQTAALGSELVEREEKVIHVPPGTIHRVVGPLEYLEVSTYDDDTDTTRLEDDFGRD